jgi:hypothetical protein
MTRSQTRTWAIALVIALTLIGLIADADQTAATFTATTQNPGNQFITATLSLTNDKSAAGALINISALIPGDTATRTVTLTNTGNIPFTYSFAASQSNNTLLWSDATNGLQVTVTRAAATLYTGALKNMGTVVVPGTVATGGTDAVSFLFSLPVSANNTFQTLTQDLAITYTATQLAGTAR